MLDLVYGWVGRWVGKEEVHELFIWRRTASKGLVSTSGAYGGMIDERKAV